MREPKVFIIVGGRGTGKTYYLENTLKMSNTVIVELVKTNRFQGFDKVFYEDFENNMINYKAIANKKIVFEDATAYVSSSMKNTLKKLIVFSKQIGSDVFIVFHSINVIPPFLWNLFNYLIMFKCPKPRETATNKEYFQELLKTWQVLERGKKYQFKVIESFI